MACTRHGSWYNGFHNLHNPYDTSWTNLCNRFKSFNCKFKPATVKNVGCFHELPVHKNMVRVSQHSPGHHAGGWCVDKAFFLCIPIPWVTKVVTYVIAIQMHHTTLSSWSVLTYLPNYLPYLTYLWYLPTYSSVMGVCKGWQLRDHQPHCSHVTHNWWFLCILKHCGGSLFEEVGHD